MSRQAFATATHPVAASPRHRETQTNKNLWSAMRPAPPKPSRSLSKDNTVILPAHRSQRLPDAGGSAALRHAEAALQRRREQSASLALRSESRTSQNSRHMQPLSSERSEGSAFYDAELQPLAKKISTSAALRLSSGHGFSVSKKRREAPTARGALPASLPWFRF
jgi:hypothetical protein